MSQNKLCVPTSSQTLLQLNLRGVNQLFPGFVEDDFALIHGSSSVLSLTSLLCVRAQLASQLGGLSSKVIFIDGGNSFRLYQIARLAQIHQLNPKQVLDNIYVSRAFTAYQLTTLIMQKLETAIKKYEAKLAIVSDISEFFLDKDLSDIEAQRVFSQIAAYLSSFAKENHVILITTYLPHQEAKRNGYLRTLASAKASVVLSLKQTEYSKVISLEKHPRLNLGSVELPSANVTLTDFMGDSA